jgi:hypothetical protein
LHRRDRPWVSPCAGLGEIDNASHMSATPGLAPEHICGEARGTAVAALTRDIADSKEHIGGSKPQDL